jgi:acyl dehydratase
LDESFITEALRARVGVASEPRRVTVSPELVRRIRETLADGPVAESEDVPPAVLSVLESANPLASVESLPGSSLVTGDEWEWRRPLRLGETLTSVNRLADAYERFGGRLGHALFLRHEWQIDDADGETVAFVRRSIAHYEGSGARPAEELPPEDLAPSEVKLPAGVSPRLAVEGSPVTPVRFTPTLGQVVRYCGAAWVFTPIFYDPVAARAWGLPDTIVPGPLKLAFLSEAVRAWIGPDGYLESVRAAHRRPDTPGHPITIAGTVTRVDDVAATRRIECELSIENAFGMRSVAGATVVRVPREGG